jgi:hypothetical protein
VPDRDRARRAHRVLLPPVLDYSPYLSFSPGLPDGAAQEGLHRAQAG